MKPSERIFELRKSVAKELLDDAKKQDSHKFLNAIMGMTEEDQLTALEHKENTTLAAILMFLDETMGKPPLK